MQATGSPDTDFSAQARGRFGRFAAAVENLEWPISVVENRGWRCANESYQAHLRALGRAEMVALLKEMGFGAPVPRAQFAAVLRAATSYLLNTGQSMAEAVELEGGIEIFTNSCPLFDRLSQPNWAGVTACGCFARLLGWHEAMGLCPDLEILATRKWGDDRCAVIARPT
jgi:hypothetical protein